MRAGKILNIVVGILAASLALVLLAVWLLVNPNHYRGKIIAAVKEATGRDLMLEGDIKLSLFPWIALEVGPAALGSPPGFSPQPFVSFRHAAVRAKLLPLFRQRLEIAKVEIEGLDVRLERNAAGKGNWEDFGRQAGGAGAGPAQAPGQPALAGLPGLKITDARLKFEAYTLEHLNVETAPFLDGTVPLSIRFDANRGVTTEQATVDAKVDFSQPRPGQYRLAALTLVGQVQLAGNSRPIHWTMSTPDATFDIDGQTFAVPVLALTLAGAQLRGTLRGTTVPGDARIAGSFTLAPVLLREFLPRWGLNSPQTRDPRAFSQMAGTAKFSYGAHALRFDAVGLTLDDTHVTGRVAIEDLRTEAVAFKLAADKIDADRYLPPEGPPFAAAAANDAATNDAATPRARDAAPDRAAHTPGGPAGPLEAQGTLTIGSLHLSPLEVTDVQATFAAKDGVARLFPLQAQVNGGRYSGDITLDRRGAVPKLTVDEHLSAVDRTSIAARHGEVMHLSGRGNINLKAQARGSSAEALLKTLNGHMDADVAGGALEGIDIGYELGRAEALIKRDSAPSPQNTNRTPFEAFKASAEITNGVAQTRDLTISSQVLRVTGQGSVQLASKAIDFELLADTRRVTQGVPLQIPVKVSGTTAHPVLQPDIEALAKGQLRRKLEDVVRDKLRGLFGK